jgi:hypothetical protein
LTLVALTTNLVVIATISSYCRKIVT